MKHSVYSAVSLSLGGPLMAFRDNTSAKILLISNEVLYRDHPPLHSVQQYIDWFVYKLHNGLMVCHQRELGA